ncbi:MAG: anaerobic ribonucleoside-triphosphate reductase [Candidatus Margulisbacteria bacterium]|nr:anaerobic ribonucleoside-triphosphate reductase [Candidatus Margulisiibacteriota bacterium]
MEIKQEIERQIEELKSELEHVKGSEAEVYARIVGYYRPVNNWNKGKKEEYHERLHFICNDDASAKKVESIVLESSNIVENTKEELQILVNEKGKIKQYKMFYSEHCPGCKPVKSILSSQIAIKGTDINASTKEGLEEAIRNNITGTPTVIFYDEQGNVVQKAHTSAQVEQLLFV